MVYIQFKYDIKNEENYIILSKNWYDFYFAFLILIYHMDENGKQTNFSQKTQNFNNKKMLFEFWVCFFFVVREQHHKTTHKQNIIIFPLSEMKTLW